MKSSDTPNSLRSSSMMAITSAWMVTSSAVVGSSARISRGFVSSAVAIMTRCSMPPESSCGYCFSRRSPSSMPTCVSMSTAWTLASLREIDSRSVSVMKSPMRRTGLVCARGSWNTTDTSCRYDRSCPPRRL